MSTYALITVLVVVTMLPSANMTLFPLADEVLSAWRRLSWRSVIILVNAKSRLEHTQSLVKKASLQGIQCVVVTMLMLGNLSRGTPITVSSDVGNLLIQQLLAWPELRPHKLMIVQGYGNFGEKVVEQFKEIRVSTAFFFLVADHHHTEMYRVQISRSHNTVISNKWPVDKMTDRYIENYDLQGIQMTTLTLPFYPYLEIFRCQTNKTSCQTQGALHDAFQILQAMFNFTLRVDQEDNWGSVPQNGSYEEGNPVFTGAMGGVIYGNYDIGLSAWHERLDRYHYMDFSLAFMTDEEVTAINNNNNGMDLTLFTRPLTVPSWLAIGVTLVLVMAFPQVMKFIYSYLPDFPAPGNDPDHMGHIKVAACSGKKHALLRTPHT